VPSTVENREKDHTSIPSMAAKSKVSPSASNAPATAVPTMPSKSQLKLPTKTRAVVRESVMLHSSPRKPKAAPENIGDPKPVEREVKGGSGPSKAKTMGIATDDSNPYSLEGAIDGLLEVGGSGGHRSPSKVKKSAKPAEDEAPAIPEEEAPTKVRSNDLQVAHRAPTPQRKKLLVFNVHGTLQDSSLLLDKNPNTAIRPTLRIAKRRVVFRPGLIDFMNKYFVHFEVAFWGSKSEVYMDDVVPSILQRMKEGSTFRPLFVWSGKECEVTKFEDGIPLKWGKPLWKVFWQYPAFNHTNTVMIDHKTCRLGGNPAANLIVPTAFYVAEVQKLGDDKAFLRVCLWPTLQALYKSEDIE
jgi:hypothetical protein